MTVGGDPTSSSCSCFVTWLLMGLLYTLGLLTEQCIILVLMYTWSLLCVKRVILTRKIMEGRRHLIAFIRCLCDAIKGLGDCTEPVHLKLSAAFPLTFKSPSTCIDPLPTTVIRSIWCIKRAFACGFHLCKLKQKWNRDSFGVCVCVHACAAVSGQNQWSLRQVQLSK